MQMILATALVTNNDDDDDATDLDGKGVFFEDDVGDCD
jgi:hypothetical protein